MLRESKLARRYFLVCVAGILSALTCSGAFAQSLTVEQVIEKNIAARGGLQAWRQIQSMSMSGKMDVGSKQNVQLPFVMTMKRPRMSRLEIEFAGKTAVQVYDGVNGWKVRPFLGRNEVESFSQAEMDQAAEAQELDGLLIDHEAKGIKVALLGMEKVEDHDAYKLKVTLSNGNSHNLWVDAKSFLEVKLEGFPRRLDGKMHKVGIYYRDYGPAGDVKVPYLFETVVEGVTPSRKMTIEKVTVNPKLDDRAFAKPEPPGITPVTAQRRTVQAQPATPSDKRSTKNQ